jgi:sigma-B regulation protein RsbU (phosphoserine phosphatase)
VFEQVTVAVEPADLLVTYTDGVTEARRGRHFFGEGRIRNAVRRSTTAAGAVAALLTAIGQFSSGGLRDDAAALVVRVGDPDGAV